MADGAVVVDVTQGFSFYEPQGDTTAWVGSGIRLGALYYYAWKDGNLSFPGGTCPNVGLAGLLLGEPTALSMSRIPSSKRCPVALA